jgi:hypothetical protein
VEKPKILKNLTGDIRVWGFVIKLVEIVSTNTRTIGINPTNRNTRTMFTLVNIE